MQNTWSLKSRKLGEYEAKRGTQVKRGTSLSSKRAMLSRDSHLYMVFEPSPLIWLRNGYGKTVIAFLRNFWKNLA